MSSRKRLLWLVLTASALGVLMLGAPAADASFPGVNGRIAFDTYGPTAGDEIWAANPDGTDRARLGDFAERSHDAAWSAGGTQLAFTRCEPDGCNNNDDIYRMRRRRGGLVQLTTDPANDWAPAWSPDGTKIAFNSARNGSHGIWIMNADGTNPSRLAFGDDPSWSPDGRKIAYHVPNSVSVNVINANGSGERTVTSGARPDWSPDGTRIAFDRAVGTVGSCPRSCTVVWDVFTIKLDGTGETRVTNNGAVQDMDPVWSPDGTRIAFEQTPVSPEQLDIVTVNPDGTSLTKVTDDSAPDLAPNWQPVPYVPPAAATPLTVSLVPAFRQTISSSQCTARGGLDSAHGPPLAFSSCDPPAYLSGTAARIGPLGSGSASLAAVADDAGTAPDEADLSIALDLSDVQAIGTGGDYAPDASGPDLDIAHRLRITDLHNGPYLADPGTAVDVDFLVPANCAPTVLPGTGSHCSVATSANGVSPGAVGQGRSMTIAVFRVRVNDAGANGTADDSDDRPFAQQGVFIP